MRVRARESLSPDRPSSMTTTSSMGLPFNHGIVGFCSSAGYIVHDCLLNEAALMSGHTPGALSRTAGLIHADCRLALGQAGRWVVLFTALAPASQRVRRVHYQG